MERKIMASMGMFSFQDLGLRQEQRLELGKLLSNKWGA